MSCILTSSQARLNTCPDLWNGTPNKILAGREQDLSDCLPKLADAGLGTLGALYAISHWDGAELGDLLEEAAKISPVKAAITIRAIKETVGPATTSLSAIFGARSP